MSLQSNSNESLNLFCKLWPSFRVVGIRGCCLVAILFLFLGVAVSQEVIIPAEDGTFVISDVIFVPEKYGSGKLFGKITNSQAEKTPLIATTSAQTVPWNV
jgi:hypothetical protein